MTRRVATGVACAWPSCSRQEDLLQEKALRDCGFAFLSSCNAGLAGSRPTSDEFAGLPAALQLAGASIVVSPLWPVDEVTAALFADLFYAELASVSAGEVDVPSLVGEVRAQLRRMDAEEAADRIEGLTAVAGTPCSENDALRPGAEGAAASRAPI